MNSVLKNWKKKKADAGSDASINTAAADSAAVASDNDSAGKELRDSASASADNDNAEQNVAASQPSQDTTANNSAIPLLLASKLRLLLRRKLRVRSVQSVLMPVAM